MSETIANNPLIKRPRRLRTYPALRAMLRETRLAASDLIYPLFIRHGAGEKRAIQSMPGIHQWTLDLLPDEILELVDLGIRSVILFGIPAAKDPIGEENFSPEGIVQQAIRTIKKTAPQMIVATDVCLCEYTDHGHCGILNRGPQLPDPNLPPDYVLNDATLEILARVACSHAEAGADIVAPSGMIDGMVAAIRRGLDAAGFHHLPILSYAVKYASAYYGPFREAAQSPPAFGDRKSHQMDPANLHEALREAALDLEEGADMLMVKPALAYLDVIHMLRQRFPETPLAAYNVSGEYAMVKAAAANGWVDEQGIILENLIAMKRAGADLILTYHAKQAAVWMRSSRE